MNEKLRIMTEKPLNVEKPVSLQHWRLSIDGEVQRPPLISADFMGPHERFAWRQWQFVWDPRKREDFTIMARATDKAGRRQPMNASWNALGYGNNGVREHAIKVHIRGR